MAARLIVDGKEQTILSDYVLRWRGPDEPVLYKMGKRVVQPWSLEMKVEMPADETGGNANTT